jgi:hypothetical protein
MTMMLRCCGGDDDDVAMLNAGTLEASQNNSAGKLYYINGAHIHYV